MKIFEKKKDGNRRIFYLFGKKILSYKKKVIYEKSKVEILNSKTNIFIRFINNIKYLFQYDLKQMHDDPNINIGQVTELAAIKTKFLWDNIKVPKIKSDMETIEELVNSNKSIIRFGDGEISMMLGGRSLFEDKNQLITNTFNEIFYKNDPNLLTGTRYDMFRINTNFMHSNISTYRLQYLLNNYERIKDLYNYDKTYYSACFIYPYVVYSDWNHDEQFNLIRRIWENKKVTIICGDRVFDKIKYNVFDNASESSYIYGPSTGAFEKFEELKSKILSTPKDSILIFALGPCGKMLAYDMYKQGYRVLDMGHLIKNYDFYQKRNEMTEKDFCRAFERHMLPD